MVRFGQRKGLCLADFRSGPGILPGSVIVDLAANFDARARSTALSHRQILAAPVICGLCCGSLIGSLAQNRADMMKTAN